MVSKPLTATNLRTAKPGDILRDTEVAGLHVRVFETKAVYYLYFRTQTRQERRLKLGGADALPIPEARRLARLRLAEVAAGRDPAQDKYRKAAEPTVNDLFELAHKEHWSAEKFERSGWKRQVRQFYEQAIKPRFGTRKASDPFDDVDDWHAGFADRPFLGNRALAVLSTLLSLAETRKLGRLRPLNSNPCTAVRKHPEPRRAVFATPEQIGRLGALLIKYANEAPAQVAFLYLLLYSGSRPSAIERATWDQLTLFEVNGKSWGLLRPPGKTGQDDIWLPPQAVAVLKRLPCTTGTLTDIKAPRKFWYKLRAEIGAPNLRMRDLRRTFATVGMSGGQPMALISEALNHKTTQTTKIYAKLVDSAKQNVVEHIADDIERFLKAN